MKTSMLFRANICSSIAVVWLPVAVCCCVRHNEGKIPRFGMEVYGLRGWTLNSHHFIEGKRGLLIG